MKLKAVVAALALAGLGASLAFAAPPPGKGRGRDHKPPKRPHPAAAASTTSSDGTTATATEDTTTAATTTAAAPTAVTLCHRTRAAARPYVLVTVGARAAVAHLRHGDVSPVDGVCPATPALPAGPRPGKLLLCHRTADDERPYVRISVGPRAAAAHLRHGDLAPAVDGTCPTSIVPPDDGSETTTTTTTGTTVATP